MPPRFVKTIEDLIYWEYSLLICQVAKGKIIFPFVTDRWKKLKSKEINIQSLENDILFQIKYKERSCVYCGSKNNLSFDHIIPKALKGPDSAKNQVLACRSCNSSKGKQDLYAWFGLSNKNKVPLLTKSIYLKLMLDLHTQKGTLDAYDLDGDGKLTVLDLGYILGGSDEA
ncbi:MAG: HNH endonuclease [Candidatus Hodarchaeota archaeon]